MENCAPNLSAESSLELGKAKLLAALAGLQGMERVEALISSKIDSEASRLIEVSRYLQKLGGKRMRPALTLMVSDACGHSTPPQSVIDIAAGIELIHMATLLHDDIIDNSPLRRHKESAFKKYGTNDTLLTGDFLLVRAFSLCARLDHFVINETELACVELTEGEILETPLYHTEHSVASSLNIAKKKTAALFRLAALCPAHIHTQNEEIVEYFRVFGESAGIAFQIVDDILDITSTEDLLGKQTGTDLRERKPSIVNVLWLQSSSSLANTLREKPHGDESEFIASAIAELTGSTVIEEAKAMANEYAEKALTALHQAQAALGPQAHAKSFENLNAILSYALERQQ